MPTLNTATVPSVRGREEGVPGVVEASEIGVGVAGAAAAKRAMISFVGAGGKIGGINIGAAEFNRLVHDVFPKVLQTGDQAR